MSRPSVGSGALEASSGSSAPQPYALDPFTAGATGTAQLVGSKSITNRALLCAALADGRSTLTGALRSDDTDAMAQAVAAAFGATIETTGDDAGGPADDVLAVLGSGRQSDTVGIDDGSSSTAGQAAPTLVEAREAGTVARFLLPVLAATDGTFLLDGAPRLRERPIDDLVAVLRQLGARIEAASGSGNGNSAVRLPLAVTGAPLHRGPVDVPANVSSQFLSGLLLAGPITPHGLHLRLAKPNSERSAPVVSRPYIDMTVAVMRTFGATVTEPAAGEWLVEPTGYWPADYRVEPDASAASYFWSAAAITHGSVRVEGLDRSSLQGDVAYVDVLAQMGARVTVEPGAIIVAGPADGAPLRGGEFDLSQISDCTQTLAAVACFADAPVTITGVGFISAKESDRVTDTVTELWRLGVGAEAHADGLTVNPSPADMKPATVNPHGDHRMAMAMALTGLRVDGVRMADPGCVAKTFPGYFAALEALRPAGPGGPQIVAIDGPAASGKSSVARAVAQRLNADVPLEESYLDTGAMYRCVAWAAQQRGIAPDSEQVAAIAHEVKIEFHYGDNGTGQPTQRVLVDGTDVSAAIREPDVDHLVSVVAAQQPVREVLVGRQQQWACSAGSTAGWKVVEGRDITSVVFPDALLKLYITASAEARAQRRGAERNGDGAGDVATESEAITGRDSRDSTRSAGPLKVAANAVIVDTTELQLDEVVGRVCRLAGLAAGQPMGAAS